MRLILLLFNFRMSLKIKTEPTEVSQQMDVDQPESSARDSNVIGGFHSNSFLVSSQEYYRGKYHCTTDLLFDWFGMNCMTIDNFCFYLQNRLIQTNQTGSQWYSDTSPFSFPCTSQCLNREMLAARDIAYFLISGMYNKKYFDHQLTPLGS
jgi:hypothetical protein